MTENTENEAQKLAHLIHKDAIILFFSLPVSLTVFWGEVG